ncbi:hypothetical protein CBS101457_005385 [Exobasidium rhododendri]|nr:hypothetical protein CBS101457_005385 [Exobasidium rhododendri]
MHFKLSPLLALLGVFALSMNVSLADDNLCYGVMEGETPTKDWAKTSLSYYESKPYGPRWQDDLKQFTIYTQPNLSRFVTSKSSRGDHMVYITFFNEDRSTYYLRYWMQHVHKRQKHDTECVLHMGIGTGSHKQYGVQSIIIYTKPAT